MRNLFTTVKPKSLKVTATVLRNVPKPSPGLASANYSEVCQPVGEFTANHISLPGNAPVSLSHDKDTRERDSHRCDISDRNVGQHDLARMIGHLTETSFEDWAVLVDVCERASATESNAKEATKALSIHLKHGDALRQLSAARLWAFMLRNSSKFFVHQCTKREFLETLEDVLSSQRTSPIVRENLLDVLAAAAHASSRTSHKRESGFAVLLGKFKPAGKPEEGVLFDPDHPQSHPTAAPPDMDSIAMHLQRGSDEEDRALSAQRTELSNSIRQLFECSICMEKPGDSIVCIDSCGHTFCRECLRGHVTALLDEYRSPILCPACTATIGKGKGKAGVVLQSLAINVNLGLTDEQFSIWASAIMNPPLSRRRATISLTPSYPPVPSQSPQAAAPLDRDSVLYAMHLQREFDEEYRAFSAQRLFECCICMEEIPVDSITRIDSCGHTFCRECLRGHITARLEERRFPILCPTCTANKSKSRGKVGEVSQSLALNLGLTDQQFSVWIEMEMVSFSVLLHCRGCQRSMFVARDELETVNIIVCPLPDCNHAWCKLCQQSIDSGGPNHSCDGTSELDHLMKKRGWKYCPTCKTPIQKTSGCNHMACITPACNTHFCYLCGDLIVKSALSTDIKKAKLSHYNKTCKLFEVPR